MRSFIVVALLAFSQVQADANTKAFEETIINTLECIREEMKVGWPEYGIPHFNPLQIEDLTVDFGAIGIEGLSGSLNIQDTVFSGITDFEVSDVSGTIGLIPPSYTVQLTLAIPNPKLSTKYDNVLVSENLGIDTFGTGTLEFEANNFKADLDLKATILGGIAVQYFNLWISMDPLTSFEITGVRDDEELSAEVSANILENGHLIVESLAQTIHDVAEQLIMQIINNGEAGEEGGFLSELLDRCLGA